MQKFTAGITLIIFYRCTCKVYTTGFLVLLKHFCLLPTGKSVNIRGIPETQKG